MADDNNLNINIGINPAGAQSGARQTTAAIGSVVNEAKDLDAAFRRLKSAIDPSYAAQEKYNRSMAEYDRLLKIGKLDQQEYAAAVDLVKRAYESQLAAIQKNSSAAKQAAQDQAAAVVQQARAREASAADGVRFANEWLAAERRNTQAIKAEVATRLLAEKAAIREAVQAARAAAAEKVAATRGGGTPVTKAAETQAIRDAAAAARAAAKERAEAERQADAEIIAEYQKTYNTAKTIVQDAATQAAAAAQGRATAERQLLEATTATEKAQRREASQAAREAAAAATQAAKARADAEKQSVAAIKEQQKATELAAIAAKREADALNEIRSSINPTFAAQQRYNEVMQKATALLMNNKLVAGEWTQIQKQAKAQMDVNVRSMGRMNAMNVQMGYQMQDVVASWASGISPLVILAQQGGQTAAALSTMGGTAGRVAAFFAGPWGAAILGAVMVLGFLWEANSKAEKSTKDLMDAEDRRRMSVKELTSALEDFVKAQREANNETSENNRLQREAARDSREIVISKMAAAMDRLRQAQAAMDKVGFLDTSGMVGAAVELREAQQAVDDLKNAYISAREAEIEAGAKVANDRAKQTDIEKQESDERTGKLNLYRKMMMAASNDAAAQAKIQAAYQSDLIILEEKYKKLKAEESKEARQATKDEAAVYKSREDAIGRAGRALRQQGYQVGENFQFGKVGNHPGMGREAHGKYAIDINIPGFGSGNPEANNEIARKRMDAMVQEYQAAGFKVLWNGKVYKPYGQGASYDIPRGQHQHRDHAHMEAPQELVGKSAGTQLAGELQSAQMKAMQDAHEAILADLEFKKEMANEDLAQQLKIQDQKIEAQRAFFGKGTKEELDAMRERARIQRQFDKQQLEEKRRNIDQRLQLDQMAADREVSAAQAKAQRINDYTEFLESNGLITEREAIARKAQARDIEYQQEVAHQERMNQLKRTAITDKLAVTTNVQERAEMHRQLEQMEAEHLGRMQQIRQNYERDVNQVQMQSMSVTLQRWRDVTTTFTQSLGSALQGIWTRTTTVKQALLNMADQLVFKFMDMGLQMVQNWIMAQLKMLLVKKTTNQAQVAATAATAAAEAGIQTATTTAAVAAQGIKTAAATTGAATQTAAAATAGTTEIGTNAAVAAAGAYKSTVVIPFIGPIAAPAAAALALAAVLGFASLISAEGGMGEVPSDQLAMVHKKEMILPAWIAEPMRKSLSAGRGSAGMMSGASAAGAAARESVSNSSSNANFYYQPKHTNMGASFDQLLREDGRSLRKWIKNQVRNGGLKLP